MKILSVVYWAFRRFFCHHDYNLTETPEGFAYICSRCRGRLEAKCIKARKVS